MTDTVQSEQPVAVQASGLRRTLLKSAAQFSVATVAAQGAGLLRTYLAARLVGPAVYGLWLGMRLLADYGSNVHLGAVFGMHRNVPLLRGRGAVDEAEEVKATSLGFVLLTGGLAAAAVVLLAFLPPSWRGLWYWRRAEAGDGSFERALLPAVAAVILANVIKSHYVTVFKAENRFRDASVASLAGSVVGVASLPFVKWFGLPGFVWGLFAMVAVETGWLALRSERNRVHLRWPVLREQLAIGLLTSAITVASTLLTSIDRTVILAALDEERLGYYGVAFIAATFLVGIAGVPNAVIYPRLCERYGATGRTDSLASIVREPLRVVSVGFALLVGLGALALPVLVRLFLPKYQPGVTAAQIAMFGTYAYVVVGMAASVFYAVNRQWVFFGILLAASGVSWLLARGAVAEWSSLPAVATGVSLGLLFYLVVIVIGTFRMMEQPFAVVGRVLLEVLAPIAWVGLAVVAIHLAAARLLPEASLRQAALSEAVFLLLLAPLLVRTARQALGGRRPA